MIKRNIGIKHDFLCILTSAWPRGSRGSCWNPSLSGPADVNVSENHAWSLVLYKIILSCNNTRKRWRQCFKHVFFLPKSSFPVPIMPRKSTTPANVLKTPLPGQIDVANYVCYCARYWYDVRFCDDHGILISKTANPWIFLFKKKKKKKWIRAG